MRKWFQPEIDFLKRHWNDYTAKEIGEMLKFSESAVSSMASKLGLKKSRDFKRRSLARAKISFHDKYILERLQNEYTGINYTTRPQSLGGGAEELFQELVPKAINANESIRVNNPDFDFIYKNLTIDVKYSSAHKRKETHSIHWSVRSSGNMDLIVGFLEREIGSELDDPYIIIIPKKLFPKEKIEIHKNGKYGNMFVEKSDLIATLDSYQTLKEIINEI